MEQTPLLIDLSKLKDTAPAKGLVIKVSIPIVGATAKVSCRLCGEEIWSKEEDKVKAVNQIGKRLIKHITAHTEKEPAVYKEMQEHALELQQLFNSISMYEMFNQFTELNDTDPLHSPVIDLMAQTLDEIEDFFELGDAEEDAGNTTEDETAKALEEDLAAESPAAE